MKLYTEEQVKKAMLEYTSYSRPTMVQVIDTLKPIELPSNEEIKDKSFNTFSQNNARTCFEEGAKWIKNKYLIKTYNQ